MCNLIKLFAVSLAFMVILLTGCNGKPTTVVQGEVLAKAGLQYYWRLDLNLGKGESLVRLARLDENLYCLTNRHRLMALDATRGLLKWSKSIADPSSTVFLPSHADGIKISANPLSVTEVLSPERAVSLPPFDGVFINTLSYMLLLDRETGEQRRQIPFDFAANTSGVSDSTYFYVGSTRGWYYAIRLNEAVQEWILAAEDMITAPIQHFRDRIYVADNSGNLYATKVAVRGTKVWEKHLNGPVTAEFHVDERGCFVACDDHRVYAFDLARGQSLWEHPFICQGPLRDPIQVSENTIYQLARRDKFYAINLATGKQRWALPEGRKVLGVSEGDVFCLSSSGDLLVVDEILGTVKTSLPMTGWEFFVANAVEPTIYAASKSGKLACIRKLEAGMLTPEDLRTSDDLSR